jgi:hypothetical protein
VADADRRSLLETLDPPPATTSVDPIHDQADRDAICELYGWPQTFVGRLPG